MMQQNMTYYLKVLTAASFESSPQILLHHSQSELWQARIQGTCVSVLTLVIFKVVIKESPEHGPVSLLLLSQLHGALM